MKKLCSIYRSSKREGMYLYVDKADDLSRVPDALLSRFGKPELVMTLLLHAGRPLARVDVNKVLADLQQQGFFLQLPPQPQADTLNIHQQNTKM